MPRLGIALFFVFFSSACAATNSVPLRLRGVWVEVHSGDTLEALCSRYGADPQAVSELNNLPNSSDLASRGELFVPTQDGAPPGDGKAPVRPSGPLVARKTAPRSEAKGTCSGESCLLWPVDGEVMATFEAGGKSPHDGIDLRAKEGSVVRAAAAGKVLYSGDGVKGYGNLVILQHENGLVTVYAHAARNLVKEGDSVERGAAVAEVGRSGSVREPHLHFEVRKAEEPMDPLGYLPQRREDGP